MMDNKERRNCPPEQILAVISERCDPTGRVERSQVEEDSALEPFDRQAVAATIEKLKASGVIEQSANGELSQTFQ